MVVVRCSAYDLRRCGLTISNYVVDIMQAHYRSKSFVPRKTTAEAINHTIGVHINTEKYATVAYDTHTMAYLAIRIRCAIWYCFRLRCRKKQLPQRTEEKIKIKCDIQWADAWSLSYLSMATATASHFPFRRLLIAERWYVVVCVFIRLVFVKTNC